MQSAAGLQAASVVGPRLWPLLMVLLLQPAVWRKAKKRESSEKGEKIQI